MHLILNLVDSSLALVDLDEFVERHLFGNDLSPPLTRSGIHKASDNWTSFNRYVLKRIPTILVVYVLTTIY